MKGLLFLVFYPALADAGIKANILELNFCSAFFYLFSLFLFSFLFSTFFLLLWLAHHHYLKKVTKKLQSCIFYMVKACKNKDF